MKNDAFEKISVVIPTFNRNLWIGKAVESVLKQSWKNIEIIIIDDGSACNCENDIPKSTAISILYFKTDNRGVASARNFGVAQSSGNWIAFLDSDDQWMPDKLTLQMDYHYANPSIHVVYTRERWIRNSKRVNPPAKYKKYSGNVLIHCLPVCLMAPSSLLLKKDLFCELGGFNESFQVCEDYDFNLRLASRYQVGLVDRELICKYGGHEDQLSTSCFGIDYWRLRALCGILQAGELTIKQVDAVHAEIDRKAAIYLSGCVRHGNREGYLNTISMIREGYPEFDSELHGRL